MSFWEQAVRRGSVQFQVFHGVSACWASIPKRLAGAMNGLLVCEIGCLLWQSRDLSAKNANNQGVALGLYNWIFLSPFTLVPCPRTHGKYRPTDRGSPEDGVVGLPSPAGQGGRTRPQRIRSCDKRGSVRSGFALLGVSLEERISDALGSLVSVRFNGASRSA